jgi:D-glucuronyl C5-epimerase C-terminus
MGVRGFTTSLVVLAVALAVVAAAPATAPVPGEKDAFQAVGRAHLDGATAAAARAEIERAVHLVRILPSGRSEHVAIALEQLAAFDGRLTEPRALVLVGQLKANDDYFSKHYAPADKTDITDEDGLVYRYFAGRCLEFHPLANFGALNTHIAAQDAEGTQRLADALLARGVYQHGGGIGWEYAFSFGGGRAPWLSGMAQAVAAQAFARAADLVPTRAFAYLREAHAAYALIPRRMLTRVAAGPWIRLYAFNSLPVLNAQLQAVLSLQSYAAAAHDSGAGALAARMQRAAAEMLPRFDTGYWTYYSLDGVPSPLDYQQYVVQLLRKLSPADPRFAAAATRIGAYEHQPPAFMVTNTGLGALRFWLSKPSSVQVLTAAGPTKRVQLVGGWQTLSWGEPRRAGVYPVQVNAVDWAGNRASFESLPIVRVTAAGKTTAARSTSATAPAPPPAFAVGAGLDDPSQLGVAKSLGLRLARMAVAWPAVATAPDPGVVSALQSVAQSTGLVVELAANPLPVDDAGRAALAQYAASLMQQVPGARGLVLAPSTDLTDYPAAFAAVRTAVQDAVPGEPVGLAVDGSHAPRTTARALASTAADFVAFHPAAAPGASLWTAANVPQLLSALGQAIPVLVDGVAAPGAASTITSLACNPNVSGVVVDGLAGVNGAAVKAAAGPAQRGLVVCPGLAIPAAATALTFPEQLDPAAPASVTFGCARDCLYLVTLERADNKPVVARRGSLRGGMPPVAVWLPQAKLKPEAYRIDVRLVNQVNPGPVTQQTSPPLAIG